MYIIFKMPMLKCSLFGCFSVSTAMQLKKLLKQILASC